MRSLILAIVLALAGAPALAETASPPTPEAVAVRISSPSGSMLEARRGDNAAAELRSGPFTGSRWTVTAKRDFPDHARVQATPVNAPAEKGRPLLGAPLWNVFFITANAAGSAPLTWEPRGTEGQVWRTFTLTINAQ